jgi:hypothetical protein
MNLGVCRVAPRSPFAALKEVFGTPHRAFPDLHITVEDLGVALRK